MPDSFYSLERTVHFELRDPTGQSFLEPNVFLTEDQAEKERNRKGSIAKGWDIYRITTISEKVEKGRKSRCTGKCLTASGA